MTTRRNPERREQLLAAADRAIDRVGPGVRMDDIAEEAGVTKPILYRHFGDKGGLYEALARRAAADLQRTIGEALAHGDDPREQVRTVIGSFLEAIEERPGLYRFLLGRAAAERPEVGQVVGDFTSELARGLSSVLDRQFRRFGLELADPEMVAHGLIGMVHQTSDWWLGNPEVSRDEVRDRLVRMVWMGLPAMGVGDMATATDRWRRGASA